MEYLDIVDENGNPTGKTVERTQAHRDGSRHRTSHVWIVRKREGRVQVLLQKRCEQKDSFPGCYDISSAGHIPAGVDYVPSAIRELSEELGLSVEPAELIDCGLHDLSARAAFHGAQFVDNQVSRVFLLWKDVELSELTLQKEELESVMWMDFEECVDAVKNNRIKNCIDPEELALIKEHF